MAVPTTKNELIEAIDRTYLRLRRDLDRVPFELWSTPGIEGHVHGTTISTHDLVAYLLGWNELVLKWHAKMAAQEPVDFPETGYKWNELGRLAQKFYGDYRALGPETLLARLDAAKTAILAIVEASDESDLYGRAWYDKWTRGRMIQFNTASPYANASGRLRKWLKTNPEGIGGG